MLSQEKGFPVLLYPGPDNLIRKPRPIQVEQTEHETDELKGHWSWGREFMFWKGMRKRVRSSGHEAVETQLE